MLHKDFKKPLFLEKREELTVTRVDHMGKRLQDM
jgi:hypothetical protein